MGFRVLGLGAKSFGVESLWVEALGLLTQQKSLNLLELACLASKLKLEIGCPKPTLEPQTLAVTEERAGKLLDRVRTFYFYYVQTHNKG